MSDIETAVAALDGHTLALCKNGEVITSDKRGVSPVIELIQSGADLRGYSVADKVVGKAAAMLFVKVGIKEVFAKTLSQSGKALLENRNVPFSFSVLTEKIINRAGTDVCPMEKAVAYTDDVETGYALICEKLEELRRASE